MPARKQRPGVRRQGGNHPRRRTRAGNAGEGGVRSSAALRRYGEDAQSAQVSESDALIALYASAGGADWKDNDNWLSTAPLGEWHGVTTDAGGNVTAISLPDNDLTGELPEELGSLSSLVFFGNNRERGSHRLHTCGPGGCANLRLS